MENFMYPRDPLEPAASESLNLDLNSITADKLPDTSDTDRTAGFSTGVPFPRGTRAHQIWTDMNLRIKEGLALMESETLESMPPEEAPPQQFLNHVLKALGRIFDVWAEAILAVAKPTADAAAAFEHLITQLEATMLAQGKSYRPGFVPQQSVSTEIRIQLHQRKQYWVARMLRKVREHKESVHAESETPALGEVPPAAMPISSAEECEVVEINATSKPWNQRLRVARENAELSRPKVMNRLRLHGITITPDAIKKHEEGLAKPRPAVQKAYAAIYNITEPELFAD
jgi:hypothetical protein